MSKIKTHNERINFGPEGAQYYPVQNSPSQTDVYFGEKAHAAAYRDEIAELRARIAELESEVEVGIYLIDILDGVSYFMAYCGDSCCARECQGVPATRAEFKVDSKSDPSPNVQFSREIKSAIDMVRRIHKEKKIQQANAK